MTSALPALCLAAVCAAAGLVLAVNLSRSGARGFMQAQQLAADRDLAEMFIFASGAKVALATLIACALGTGAAWLAGAPWPVLLFILLTLLNLPRVVIGMLRRRRLARMLQQLPDALAFWAGLLQAGQGLHPSLAQLADRQARPLGDELRVVVRQCRFGVPADAAVEQMCGRLGLADLRMLATLLRLSRDLGGNLGESLLRLSELLRARLAMEARIRSLTSQGRLQGVIVGALPAVLLLVLSFMEPEAIRALFTTPVGWATLALIAALEAAGYVLIRRIVSIEV